MKKLLVIFTLLLTLAIGASAQNLTPELISEDTTEAMEDNASMETSEVEILDEGTSLFETTTRKILGAIVALIILIIIVRIAKKTNSDKLYKKAESLHREAKDFHDDGDAETAEELYEKAEELRQKARDSQNEV